MTQKSWSDEQVLSHFKWESAPLLGEGGEARVFGIDRDRIVRLVRPGGLADEQNLRAELLESILSGHKGGTFRTPSVLDICEIGGRIAVIEERLPGISLAAALEDAEGGTRRRLIHGYLEAAASIGDIAMDMDFWGDIVPASGIRSSSYKAYLADKLHHVRSVSGHFANLVMADPDAMPDCASPALVHFNIFPNNVLVEGDHVSAVIDFGSSSMMADRRLDIWSAVAYLDPEISPSATAADRRLALEWMGERDLSLDYAVAKRWIASFWCFAHDDPAMRAWCARILTA